MFSIHTRKTFTKNCHSFFELILGKNCWGDWNCRDTVRSALNSLIKIIMDSIFEKTIFFTIFFQFTRETPSQKIVRAYLSSCFSKKKIVVEVIGIVEIRCVVPLTLSLKYLRTSDFFLASLSGNILTISPKLSIQTPKNAYLVMHNRVGLARNSYLVKAKFKGRPILKILIWSKQNLKDVKAKISIWYFFETIEKIIA